MIDRLRISAWLWLGNLALLVSGVLLMGLPVLLYFVLPGLWAVLAAVLTLTVVPFGLAMLRVPFSQPTTLDEDGLALNAEEAPALFLEIERIRSELGAPTLDAVYLTSRFNASIRQHRVFGGKTRNVLWLGLPLLDSLSPAACSAILAHEYAHIAQRHGRYASRVYFARLQWEEVSRRLDRNRNLSGAPLRLFVSWYVPRFLDFTLDFARQCEYQADAESARLCGADTAAQALIALTVQRRALADHFWPALYRRAGVEPLLPLHELAGQGLFEAPVDAAQARGWLHETLCETTERDDTHPALIDRLTALGFDCQRLDLPLDWQRAQPSAALTWLETLHLEAARQMDEAFAEEIARYREESVEAQNALLAEHHALLRKQRIRTLSEHEVAHMAGLYISLFSDCEQAAALLETTLKTAPDHPGLLYQRANCYQRAGQPQAASVHWQALASQPGTRQLHALRQLSEQAMREEQWPLARRYREEADQLQRQACESREIAEYSTHQLAPAERQKLAQTLAPLLRVANGVWLLSEGESKRHVLLVQASQRWVSRLICRLTGEENPVRRDCELLLDRLSPRIHLPVSIYLVDHKDPRLAYCNEAARIS